MFIDLNDVSEKNALAHIKGICANGPRRAGTFAEQKAQDYIVKSFADLGLKVNTEKFSYLNSRKIDGTLQLLKPVPETFASEVIDYSGSGEFEGPLVYVGSGEEGDFQLANKLYNSLKDAITISKASYSFNAALLCSRYGGKGLVLISDVPMGITRHNVARFEEVSNRDGFKAVASPVITVTISAPLGERLLTYLGLPEVKIARITAKVETEQCESANVVATLDRGTNKKIIFGAHYDSHAVGGVTDNAAGVSAMLEIARLLKGCPAWPITTEFVAFGCEELGAWGSRAFVNRHSHAMDDYLMMINIDNIGSMMAPTKMLHASADIITDVEAALADYSGLIDQVIELKDSRPIDATPFLTDGIPSLWLTDTPPGSIFYHTAMDMLRYLSTAKINCFIKAGLIVVSACLKKNGLAKDEIKN